MLAENRDFFIPMCATPVGGSRNIATPFAMEKLEWCGYPRVKKSLMIYLAIWVE